jgi:hypothetical protein
MDERTSLEVKMWQKKIQVCKLPLAGSDTQTARQELMKSLGGIHRSSGTPWRGSRTGRVPGLGQSIVNQWKEVRYWWWNDSSSLIPSQINYDNKEIPWQRNYQNCWILYPCKQRSWHESVPLPFLRWHLPVFLLMVSPNFVIVFRLVKGIFVVSM